MSHDFSKAQPGDKVGVKRFDYGSSDHSIATVTKVTRGRRGGVVITTDEKRTYLEDGRETVKGSRYNQLVPLTPEHLRRVQVEINERAIRKVNWGLLSEETVAQVLDVLRAAGVSLPAKVIE